MSEKKKQRVVKQEAEHQFRCGEVTAAIYRRQSNGGFVYFEYVLTRSWQTTTGRTATANTFHPKHETSLIEAIQKASEFVRQQFLGTQLDTSRPPQRIEGDVADGTSAEEPSQAVKTSVGRAS